MYTKNTMICVMALLSSSLIFSSYDDRRAQRDARAFARKERDQSPSREDAVKNLISSPLRVSPARVKIGGAVAEGLVFDMLERQARSDIFAVNTTQLSQLVNPKTMLATGVIAASIFGGTYAFNDTLKAKVNKARNQFKSGTRSFIGRVSDWFNQPLTKLDTYAALGALGVGYGAHKIQAPTRLYQAGLTAASSAATSLRANAKSAATYISNITVPASVIGAVSAMSITGCAWALYKKFTQPSNYIVAYRKFESSLRNNFLEIQRDCPQFIKLYAQAEQNPSCLLEQNTFEEAPIVKMLTPSQKQLLQNAITLFNQQKKQ
jgi:hypothetical protein